MLSAELRAGLLEDGFLHSSPDALALIPHGMAVKYGVLAERVDGNELYVVVPESADDDLLDRIRAATGMRVRAREAPREDIRRGIARGYAAQPLEALEDIANDPPAIRAVDALHDAAVRANASDIHIEPGPSGGRVRLRVDGMLRELQPIPEALFLPVISRIKLLASMDIAERRQPQDGRYALSRGNHEFDARVSSVPTIAGERVVVRLLDLHARVPSLASLGMSPAALAAFRAAVHAAHGFLVVCGPTGSGKTTTLYASLAERNVEHQQLCSVEDPVEVRMNGVAQVQVNARAGVTFASAMRAFLRQDPNVIMLGEMRDADSASVAVSAALSGQMVLTTLHASDAPRSIERLAELGLNRQTIASGITAIVAQRLVRRLCERCKRPSAAGVDEAAALGLRYGTPVFEATGCDACQHAGYRGRTGIFELLNLTSEIRSAIDAGEPVWNIAQRGVTAGYEPLAIAAAKRVLEGETSCAEVRRVLGSCGA